MVSLVLGEVKQMREEASMLSQQSPCESCVYFGKCSDGRALCSSYEEKHRASEEELARDEYYGAWFSYLKAFNEDTGYIEY